MDAKTMWEELRAEMLRRIDEIDEATPWQSVEPDWWLHMSRVQLAILRSEPQ